MGLLCLDIVPCYDWKGGSVLNKDFTLISIKITSDCFLNEIQTKVKTNKKKAYILMPAFSHLTLN